MSFTETPTVGEWIIVNIPVRLGSKFIDFFFTRNPHIAPADRVRLTCLADELSAFLNSADTVDDTI